jgi:CHAT domain-containing protein
MALVEYVCINIFDFQAVPARGQARWKPSRYLAFVLSGGEPDNVRMIDLGEAEPIDRLIADFRAAVTGDPETRARRDVVFVSEDVPQSEKVADPSHPALPPGATLRRALFDPLLPALAGRTRLLLAPDGDLSRLPFEVLPGADGRRLIDDYRISYLSVGRDALRFGAAHSGQLSDPLVVCDPDFDLTAGGVPPAPADAPPARRSRDLDRSQYHFSRLPGTRAEGERIAAMLGVTPWLEQSALEGRLKQSCRAPRVLHLSTHGFFLQDQPHDPNRTFRDVVAVGGSLGAPGRLSGPLRESPLLRSGLALAGANTWLREGSLPPEAEDGLLTAEDVSGLDLLGTELVVLSACETGLGEVRTGEGVFGLRRAFVLAGAETLVMSLWKVPDLQTQELMVDFYRRVLAGQPRADALRDAQLALKERYPDPYYWGAFVCQGDPGPLSAASSGPPPDEGR